MPHVARHDHGTPSWIDLSTTDTGAAKAFYSALFGWEWDDNPTDQGGVYHMGRLGDSAAAGMMAMMPDQAEAGMPPMWNTYVSVDDVDAMVAKVGPAGGSVIMPPMQVMESGHMAVVMDPTGAVVSMWQANEHIGAEVVNEPGALCWNEVQTPDIDAATAFYHDVFGWTAEPMDMGPDGPPYSVFMNGETGVGGALPPSMEGVPAHWSTVFAVTDCDDACATASANGGSVLAAPMDIPVGRMAVIADPQGAVFQVIKLAQPVD